MESRTTSKDGEGSDVSNSSHVGEGTISLQEKGRKASRLLYRDFRDAYGQLYVVKWSLWWALGMCGNYQVGGV